MQPSMGTLNTPSSRVVKDSTPSQRRILRCIKFGISESSPNWFFEHGKSLPSKIWSIVNLERTGVLLFYYFLHLKVNIDLEKTNQLGESSPNFIFSAVNLDPIVTEKRWTDGWPNEFVEKVNRGQDLRWVSSRCPLMRHLIFAYNPGVITFTFLWVHWRCCGHLLNQWPLETSTN